MMGLVEALSGYKMKFEDEAVGEKTIKEAAKKYDDSDTEYIGILKSDWSDTDEKDDGHFMGLTGETKGTLETADSSNRDRETDNDFRTDVGEVPGRLDTYSFSSGGTMDSSFNIEDYLPKESSGSQGGQK